MADTNIPPPILPDHIDETIRSIAQLRAEHHDNATSLQRTVDRMTILLSRPRFIGVITVIVVGWMSLNLLAAALGVRPIDPPPFAWLGGAVSLVSLYMVVLILATQRREDQLAQRRELLILELAILSEQKTAKVIQLLDRVPPRQSAHSQPARSGSRNHGSACRSTIGARRDQGDPRVNAGVKMHRFGAATTESAQGFGCLKTQNPHENGLLRSGLMCSIESLISLKSRNSTMIAQCD